MFDFLLVIPKKGSPTHLTEHFVTKLLLLRSCSTDERMCFKPEKYPSTRIWIWHKNVAPYPKLRDNVKVNNGLRAFQGIVFDDNMNPVKNIDGLPDGAISRSLGDYFILQSDDYGKGRINRSDVCNYPLFYGENNELSVVSSRSSIAAAVLHKCFSPPIEPGFIRWVSSYGVPGNELSLFKGIHYLQSNKSLSFDTAGVSIRSKGHSTLFNWDMRELYKRKPKEFWDFTYERLLTQLKSIDLVDYKIYFPLSGGKDSRLLFGLLNASGHKDRISRVFTNGPEISPEVRAAKDICGILSYDHEFIDNSHVSNQKDIILSNKITNHFSITEGEISPMDLFWNRSTSNILQIHGQEGGLRNISGNIDLSDINDMKNWFSRHLANGDVCGIFNQGIAELNMMETNQFIEECLEEGIPSQDIPTYHRIMFRMNRWVGRTWKGYNETLFAPYIFVNSAIIKATFSAGASSRINEEFHFEMLRRIDERLISIPFANQEWSSDLQKLHSTSINSKPYTWPKDVRLESIRPTHQV